MWIDLKGVKRQVTMEMLLDRYGAKLRKVNQIQLRGLCPLPSHSSKESKWSFNVNTEKNIWSCKSASCVSGSGRKGGNVLDFVAQMEKCTLIEAAKKIVAWYPVNGDSPKVETPPPAPVAEINRPLAFELKGICYCDYLKERGIKRATAESFGVGFFPGKGSMEGRMVIPILNEGGELVAYAGRSIVDDQEPRYKFPGGFHKGLVVFNLDKIKTEAVVVVEGFFDCMNVTQAGHPCVAVMGSTISDEQAELLARFKFITLMLDGDEAGREGAKAIAAKLCASTRAFVRVIKLLDNAQPDQLTPEAISALLF